MSKIALSYNGKSGSLGTVTMIIKGAAYQLTPDHQNYKVIKELLHKDDVEDKVLELFNAPAVEEVAKAASDVVSGKITIKDGRVFCDGEEVHNAVASRIRDFQEQGLPFEPLVRFLEKLVQNPSYKSRQDLYDFLEHKNLPITEDGDFLAYKAVREDWLDIYSGSIDNSPGQVVSMDRGKVDDNHDHHCSRGLHCGAMDYVTQYGQGDSRIVIVKVNPRDAISVPRDYSFMKLRVCRYEVVQEYSGDLVKHLYTNTGEAAYDDYEEEYDDQDFIDRLEDSYYENDSYDENDYDEDEEDDSFDEGDVTSERSNLDSKAEALYEAISRVFGLKHKPRS